MPSKDVEKNFSVNEDGKEDGQTEKRSLEQDLLSTPDASPDANFCERGIVSLRKQTERFFYFIGTIVGKQPTISIIVPIVISGLLILGFLMQVTKTQPIDIWVDPNSDFVSEKNFFDDHFTPFYRIEQFIIYPKDVEGADVLQGRYFAELYRLESQIKAIEIQANGTTWRISDLCAHAWPNSPCLINTVLDYFKNYNETQLSQLTSAQVHSGVSGGGKTPFNAPLGKTPYPDVVVGGLQRNADEELTFASALMTTFPMNGSTDLQSIVLLFETAFLDVVNDFNATSQTVYVFAQAERSIDDVLAERTNADIYLVVLNYVIMIVFTAFALGQFDLLRTKIVLGILAIAIVGLATASGLGFCLLVGVPFSPITGQVIPFLVLGLAVNDIFVITEAYSNNEHIKDPVKRLAVTYSYIAASTFLSTLSNVSALAVGTWSSMPAVRWFCIQGAVCLILVWFIYIFCWGGLLIWDTRRIQARRVEILTCIKLSEERNTRCGKQNRNFFRLFLEKILLPAVLHPIGRVFVWLAFIAVFILSIFGALKIEKGLGVDQVVPRDSYVVPFLQYRQDYFELSAPVYGVVRDVDYTDYDVQAQLTDLQITLAESGWTSVGAPISWWSDFNNWMGCGAACGFSNAPEYVANGKKIPKDKFAPWLKEFLNDPTFGKFYTFDVSWDASGEKIAASRFLTYSVPLVSASDYVDAITDQRSGFEDSSLNSFAYSVFYIYFEQYLLIDREAYRGILTSMAVVAVISFLFLMHPVAAPVSMIVIGMITTDMLGIMYIWDIDMNALSVVNLITSIGLSVSFSVYFTRAYLISKKETPRERAEFAIVELGTSVLSGALATWLGVLVLAFAQYEVFRIYFFRMYFSMILIGVLHGFLFVPVYLTTIGEFVEFMKRCFGGGDEKKKGYEFKKAQGTTNTSPKEQKTDSDHTPEKTTPKTTNTDDEKTRTTIETKKEQQEESEITEDEKSE